MESSTPQNAAFSGYDLSSAYQYSNTNTCRHRDDHDSSHKAADVSKEMSPHSSCSGSDPESWLSYPSRHTVSDSAAKAAPFEVPKHWREAMQCVSINANLYPQQILHKYYSLYPSQAALHPGYIELDVWRSKRASERGVRLVHIRYLDDDPSKIYLMVIFVDAFDPNTNSSIIRLVTNTSIHHVLEEPCANCPLWLKVHSDVGPDADSPYQIIPCCDQWVECVDFDAPISNEEKQVPAVVARLLGEYKRKNLLLHAKEREIEAKDDQLRQLREDKGNDNSSHSSCKMYNNMNTLDQYWWVAAILAIALLVLILK